MLDAVKYDGSQQHDALLAQWYIEIKNNGDLERAFLPYEHPIGRFFAYFQRDAELVFQVRDGKIVRAAWFFPVMGETFIGLWFSPSLRGRAEGVFWAEAVCRLAFKRYKVLIAVTKQENLVAIFQRFGYTLLGLIPHLWKGESCWVLTLVPEDLPSARKARRNLAEVAHD